MLAQEYEVTAEMLRKRPEMVRFLELEGASLVPALQALFDGSPDVSTQQLLQTKTPAYLDAVLPLKPLEEKSHYRYQTLPVYPKGWDMVIRQEGKSLDTWSVSNMDLPPRLLEALLQICRRPTGLVLFTGTVGSDKSTLMKAMVRQMNANTRPSLKPNQPIPGSSRVGKICALDNTITDRDLPDVKHLDVYAPHATIDPQDIFRSDVDRVLMGELSSSKQARNMKKLLQSGVSVWATTSASGSMESTLERLDGFLPRHDWTQADGLQGWTYSILLPVLCRHCSKLTGNGQERAAGSGCGHCGMLGVSGRQLIVGLWETEGGRPKLLFSHTEQARELVEQGRMAREDAESLLGPIG